MRENLNKGDWRRRKGSFRDDNAVIDMIGIGQRGGVPHEEPPRITK